MKWNQLSSAIYNATTDIVKVDQYDIEMLKAKVLKTPDKRIRICMHKDSAESLHEMIIVIAKDSYIRPHKHANKSESFHIIEGELDVIIFDDRGNISEIIAMGDARSGKNFFYRLSTPKFHTLNLHSDLVVMHEITNGPFVKEETLYAEWAPNAQDSKGMLDFVAELSEKVGKGL